MEQRSLRMTAAMMMTVPIPVTILTQAMIPIPAIPRATIRAFQLKDVSNTTTVSFSAAVYSIEAIKKAAYRLSDRMTADITPRADVIECTLHPVSKEIVALTDLAHAFRAEVLDQDLRASIAAETAAFRNAILAHAFSKTGLQDSE